MKMKYDAAVEMRCAVIRYTHTHAPTTHPHTRTYRYPLVCKILGGDDAAGGDGDMDGSSIVAASTDVMAT